LPPCYGAAMTCIYAMALPWHTSIHATSCEIWIITIYLFKNFTSCRLFSMDMSFLNCHMCFRLCIGLHRCRTWIESMMAMFNARLSQPISRIILGLALKKLVAWVICGVYMTNVRTSCDLAFAMKFVVHWMHTYSSRGSNGVVSFRFLLSM
jgi:hypothetical protein